MNYPNLMTFFKSRYKKNQLRSFEQIKRLDTLELDSKGHNDNDGYQVFTPLFIVENMCSSIGEEMFDFSKNILEPTSGDRAFTTYILRKRLEKAYESGNFELDSLKALSTIYSIEMDEELIIKQRNNIFTLFCNFIDERKINLPLEYYEFLKCMIFSNFIWAMFNTDKNTQSMASFNGETDLAFAMPNAEKNKENDNYIRFPVWNITNDSISMREEGAEL